MDERHLDCCDWMCGTQSHFDDNESPHWYPCLPRCNMRCDDKGITCAASFLPQAAEAKAYYGLARNYRALEALVAALEHREILSGDELREVRRRSPARPPTVATAPRAATRRPALGVTTSSLFSSSWRGVALPMVNSEQDSETYLAELVCLETILPRSWSAPSPFCST